MYSLKDTVAHCFWYFVAGLMDVVRQMVSQWTWWHTAAVLIPMVPGGVVRELIGPGFLALGFQVAAGLWLLACADRIYEEEYENV